MVEEKRKAREQSTVTSLQKTDVKARAILRARSHTELKASRQRKKKPPMLRTRHPSSRAPAGTQCDHGGTIRLRSLGAQPLHGASGWRQKLPVLPDGDPACVASGL